MTRQGYTIIELLVTIAVVGVLVALIVPAVHYARESARRTECGSRLSQFGKAIHGFEATTRQLPDNTLGARSPLSKVGVPNVQLLPWLELPAVYDQLSESERLAGPIQSTWDGAPRIPVFRCPSDAGYGKSNFTYCVGSAISPGATEGEIDGEGAFSVLDKEPKLSDVTDGSSNTAAMSERLTGGWDANSFQSRRDLAYSGIELLLSPSEIPPELLRSVCRELRPQGKFNPFTGRSWTHGSYLGVWYNHVLPPNPDCPPCATHGPMDLNAAPFYGPISGIFSASSEHGGIVNVLLLDGSVRAVSDHVDPEVWRAAGTRAGGEVSGEW